jgi:hypothetical protein
MEARCGMEAMRKEVRTMESHMILCGVRALMLILE